MEELDHYDDSSSYQMVGMLIGRYCGEYTGIRKVVCRDVRPS